MYRTTPRSKLTRALFSFSTRVRSGRVGSDQTMCDAARIDPDASARSVDPLCSIEVCCGLTGEPGDPVQHSPEVEFASLATGTGQDFHLNRFGRGHLAELEQLEIGRGSGRESVGQYV